MNKLSSFFFVFFHCKVSSGAQLLWGKPPPTHIGKCILAHKHGSTRARSCSPTQRSIAAPRPPTHASPQMSSYTRRCISPWHAGPIGAPRARHTDNARRGLFFTIIFSLPPSHPLSLIEKNKKQTQTEGEMRLLASLTGNTTMKTHRCVARLCPPPPLISIKSRSFRFSGDARKEFQRETLRNR